MQENELLSIIDNTNAMLNRKGLGKEFFEKLGIKQLEIPGIKGFISPVNSEQMNHVGLASLTSENADETIGKVIDLFKTERKSFSWIVGPSSTPKDLPQRLIKSGFQRLEETKGFGMAISTSYHMNVINKEISVEEVSLDELENNLIMIVDSFGESLTAEGAEVIINGMRMLNSTERYRGQVKAYLAVERDTGKRVGFSFMEMDREEKYAILDGSAVLPSYRNKGIYRSMVSKRLEDARMNGIEFLIIHAMARTSAPICERIGFKRICQFDFYGYKIEE
jgi:GNAT superfamily N-acetyltransferase